MNKKELREKLRCRLRAEGSVEEKSTAIWARLLEVPQVLRCLTIAGYCHISGEVQTRNFFQKLWKLDKELCVPCCEGQNLAFYRLESLKELSCGRYEILEPSTAIKENPLRPIAPGKIDLILVPGLAFSSDGGRLGRGKGFYDRFLAQLGPDTLRIGLAFESQILDKLPQEPHDQRMDLIVTENRIYGL